MRGYTIAVAALMFLTACSGGAGLSGSDVESAGPDDFSVMPMRALEAPASLATLPEPTPNGTNLADPNPTADAIIALGGRPSAAIAGGIPAADAALVTAVSRYGVASDIRAVVAAEDSAFRKTRSRLGIFGLFSRDKYFAAYASQALDAMAELFRFRALGVRTPSAPPAE